MGHILERALLYRGNNVCDACHVHAGYDHTMIRTPINMLVWNFVVLITVISIY